MVNIEDIKLPPHNVEAEKATISAVLLDNEILFAFDGFAITNEDFYNKEHQLIWQAIEALWMNRKVIDVLTLSDQLTKLGNLDIIGGSDYLFEISTYLVSANGSSEYAKIVKEKAILRKILKVSQKIIGDVYEQKETEEIIDEIEKKIFDLTQINSLETTKHIKSILDERIAEYMDIVDNPEKIDQHKVKCEYKNLDDTLGGMTPGQLIILAARPAMGKTAFALNLLVNVALKPGRIVAMFSLEMGSDQIVDRMLSLVAQVPMSKISKGQLSGEDFAALGNGMEVLGESNIFIDDKAAASIPQLKSKLRRLKIEKGGLDLVVIDYLQLMNAANSRFAGNKVQEVSEISKGLKELARELEVPIIALSQLSRKVEERTDKRPGLSDLRESGSIEQDADTVIMIYREDYYDQDTERQGTADILVRKNRNGPTGEIEFKFEKAIMKFMETDKGVGLGE